MKQWIVKYSTYRSRIASQTAPCSQVSKYFSFHYSSNKIKSLNIHAEHSNALLRPRTVGFARASSGLWVIREAVSSYVLNSTPAPTPYSLPSRVATTKTFAQPIFGEVDQPSGRVNHLMAACLDLLYWLLINARMF
jgi:hypothetical protein